MKTAFLLKNNWIEIFDRLSDKQAGMLIKMLFAYNVNGDLPAGMNDEVVNAYFNMMRLDSDTMKENYDRRCETSAQNGKSGGRPRKGENLNKPNSKPKKPNNLSKPDNECECECDYESDCEEIPPLPPKGGAGECEDFSNLPENLQASLATYFAVRAESGTPIKAIQQSLMVAKLLSATGGDFAKANQWVKTAAAKNWKDFYEPFADKPKEQSGKQDKSVGVATHPDNEAKYAKWDTSKTF